MAIWSYIYKVCTASDAENSSEFDMKNWSKGLLDVQTERVVDGIVRNGIVLIIPTPISASLWLRSPLRFSIFTSRKLSYNFDFDSVPNENQS